MLTSQSEQVPFFRHERRQWRRAAPGLRIWSDSDDDEEVPSEEFKFNNLIRDGNIGKMGK